jgi:hypothetical protein
VNCSRRSETFPFSQGLRPAATPSQLGALDALGQLLLLLRDGAHLYERRGALASTAARPPRVLPPEVLHADGPSPGDVVLRIPAGLGLHHLPDSLADSLHGFLHPSEGGDSQLE